MAEFKVQKQEKVNSPSHDDSEIKSCDTEFANYIREQEKFIHVKTEKARIFILSQFIKAFIYHFLNAFLGPLILPFLFCRETKFYLRNLAFLPSSNPLMTFIFGS